MLIYAKFHFRVMTQKRNLLPGYDLEKYDQIRIFPLDSDWSINDHVTKSRPLIGRSTSVTSRHGAGTQPQIRISRLDADWSRGGHVMKCAPLIGRLRLRQNRAKLTSIYYSGLNYFWSIDNSMEFLNKLSTIPIADSITTFDFSTLYTNLPLDNIYESLERLLIKMFKN